MCNSLNCSIIKEDLDSLGFEWRIRDNTYKQQVVEELFDQVYECLTIYGNVPPKFVVQMKNLGLNLYGD